MGGRVFGYDVVMICQEDEPNFNLPRQTTPSTAGRQVEVRLAFKSTFL
jgi:hypothetical protein